MSCDFSMDSIQESEPDLQFKLCPSISGPNKASCPKINRRQKDFMKQAMEKKNMKLQNRDAKKLDVLVKQVAQGRQKTGLRNGQKGQQKKKKAPPKKNNAGTSKGGNKRVSGCQQKKMQKKTK